MFEEEPLDRFRQRALALASQMRFDPFLVNEAIATLTGSLGTEWVTCRADTQQRGTPWPFRDPLSANIGEAFATFEITEEGEGGERWTQRGMG